MKRINGVIKVQRLREGAVERGLRGGVATWKQGAARLWEVEREGSWDLDPAVAAGEKVTAGQGRWFR